ncbi:MAG: SIMPL domain-containing protein [Clostridiales bacterium]|jgi:uncharacterized protein YggE|nr:SIMPL domain-containing protein [Clostridiales bacterium]
MKKLWIPAAALMLAGAGALLVSAVNPLAVKAAGDAGRITVSGRGSVNAKPDIAYVSIGYTNQNVDSKTAQTENSAQMEKVIAAIKSMGIADKDIQTVQFGINPQYDYQNGNKITGYDVTNMVRVTVRKLEQTGELVDKAVDAGANAGGDIQFTIANPAPYYEQAMDLAIQNANSKAAAISKSLKVTIGKPIEVTEMGGNYTPVLYGNANSELLRDKAASMPVQSGDLSVSAEIQAAYAY